jgi:hypothetical protein
MHVVECGVVWCGVVWSDMTIFDVVQTLMTHYSAAITSLLPQHLFKAIVTCKYIPPSPSLLGHVQVRSVRGGSLCGVQVWVHDAAGQRHHKGQSHLPPHSLTCRLAHLHTL